MRRQLKPVHPSRPGRPVPREEFRRRRRGRGQDVRMTWEPVGAPDRALNVLPKTGESVPATGAPFSYLPDVPGDLNPPCPSCPGSPVDPSSRSPHGCERPPAEASC